MIGQERSTLRKKAASQPDWDRWFKVGDVTRAVSGGGTYNRGQIVKITGKERYCRVDYGRPFCSRVRKEHLEPFNEKGLVSGRPRSFSLPPQPFLDLNREPEGGTLFVDGK